MVADISPDIIRRKPRGLETTYVSDVYCHLCFILPYSIWFTVIAFEGTSDQSPPHTAFVMTHIYVQQSFIIVYRNLAHLGLQH